MNKKQRKQINEKNISWKNLVGCRIGIKNLFLHSPMQLKIDVQNQSIEMQIQSR